MASADPYVLARRALLDALDALGPQREAVVLCGAQAIYLHVGEADFAVAPYTTDADIGLRVEGLLSEPALGAAMRTAGFSTTDQPGTWVNADGVAVDLLVPESLGGPGRRGARLGPPHGSQAARKVRGLEAIVVDFTPQVIASFEEGVDKRAFEISVAGPAALLVSKLHKIGERVNAGGRRLDDKDALDIYRLLRSVHPHEMRTGLGRLRLDPLAGSVTEEALVFLGRDFGKPDAAGVLMTARGLAGVEDPDTTAASCVALVEELFDIINGHT